MVNGKTMRWNVARAFLLLAILAAGCACSRSNSSTGAYDLRAAVKTALRQVEYRRGSRIKYFETAVSPGGHVSLQQQGPGLYGPPFALTERGYLVFIDEQPGYDWGHATKVLFFPAANPERAIIIFRDAAPPIACTAPDGTKIGGRWLDF
jgi:hypothetical protein